jgi:hypothetical protein
MWQPFFFIVHANQKLMSTHNQSDLSKSFGDIHGEERGWNADERMTKKRRTRFQGFE